MVTWTAPSSSWRDSSACVVAKSRPAARHKRGRHAAAVREVVVVGADDGVHPPAEVGERALQQVYRERVDLVPASAAVVREGRKNERGPRVERDRTDVSVLALARGSDWILDHIGHEPIFEQSGCHSGPKVRSSGAYGQSARKSLKGRRPRIFDPPQSGRFCVRQ